MADSIFLEYATESGARNVVDDCGGDAVGEVLQGANGVYVAHLPSACTKSLSASRKDRIRTWKELKTSGFFDFPQEPNP